MAEAAKHPEKDEHGAKDAAHEAHADENPMAHIMDVVWYGVDKSTGKVVSPYDSHGHIKPGYETYAPATIGPIKLEFTKHMFGLTVAATLFFVVSMLVARRVLAGIKGNHAPKGKLANAVEAIVVYVRDEIVMPVGGHHLAHYTPLFINYFMLILICNYLGMIPEFGSATGNFGVTAALALTVYALIWILGIAHNGFGYITHLVPSGTPIFLYPLMFILEIMGPIIKCFVLAVRLFANMIAGHLVISNLLALGKIAAPLMILGVPLALGVSMLEVLVCVLQAYVFTLLAVIFIGGAVHPEH
ncbi:MAG TPA: F0F1 ATP synthase subunit A [Planctomycetota bacterium]|nr:F0F1 ATP synthase subunit A [Planctomycetota bacterium]